jgi:hypothetical protein
MTSNHLASSFTSSFEIGVVAKGRNHRRRYYCLKSEPMMRRQKRRYGDEDIVLDERRSSLSRRRRRRNQIRASASSSTTHSEYIENAASIARTKNTETNIQSLLRVLQAKEGLEIVEPNQRRNVHPLVVPVAKELATSTTIGIYIPHDDVDSLSIVRVSSCGKFLTLLARNPKEFIHREIVVEEAATDGAERALFDASGEVGKNAYELNDYSEKKGKLTLDQYLTMKVGRFPSSLRGLVERHLERKDEESALVACDVFKNQFQNWGEVYAFISDVYASLNRMEEARDFARSGVQCPWSTFETRESLDRMIERAGWGETSSVAEIRKILDTRKGPGRDQFVDESKEKAKAEEDAEDCLNAMANGEKAIVDTVIQLAECYSRAGKEKHAKFVMCASSPF